MTISSGIQRDEIMRHLGCAEFDAEAEGKDVAIPVVGLREEFRLGTGVQRQRHFVRLVGQEGQAATGYLCLRETGAFEEPGSEVGASTAQDHPRRCVAKGASDFVHQRQSGVGVQRCAVERDHHKVERGSRQIGRGGDQFVTGKGLQGLVIVGIESLRLR